MIKLRDYQADMISRARESLRKNQRVILQAPTGAGKTVMAAYMMREARERGISTFFVVQKPIVLGSDEYTQIFNGDGK